MQNLRRNSLFMAAVLLFLALAPANALAGDGYADYLAVRAIEEQELLNNNRLIDVPGRGPTLFYAQTNPFWKDMRYEVAGSAASRRFGDSGCCPTSAAIAFANLLPAEELGKIRPFSSPRVSGYGFALNSMNPLDMNGRTGVYWLDGAADYQRYLPLVFGQYAAGNNDQRHAWRSKQKESSDGSNGTGTGIGFVPKLCTIYGLRYIHAPDRMNMDWVEPVRKGAIAIALANSQWHPFAAGRGHYVAIVGCDEEYLYIMDPQDKTKYDTDRKNILEVMEQGFVRVKLSDYKDLLIGNIYVITNEEVDARLASAGLPIPN